MTPPPRPGDAARRALRAARERAETERARTAGLTRDTPEEAAAEPTEGEATAHPESGDGTDPGPVDEGRAGLAGGGSIAGDRVPSDGETEPGGVPRAGLVAGGRGGLDDAVVSVGGGAPGDEGPEGIAGTGGDRPGDVARAALRAAVATRRGRGAPPTAAGPAPVADADGPVVEGDRAEAARPEAGSGREAGAIDAAAAAAGAADGSAEDAGPAGATGGRPGDVAREALRAARREASRAQAADPRPERRTPARSATATPRTSPASGQQTSAARTKAAQDMRHYLATAFRMPTWAETPEEPEEHAPPTPTGPTPPAPASAPPPPASGPSETVPAVRTPALPTEPSASVPSAPSVSGPSAEVSRTTASAPEGQAPTPEPSAHTSARPGPDGPFARWTPAARPTPAQAVPSEPSAHPAPGTSPAPAVPHVPTTMATPHRDTELRRTFPAFAPRESAGGTGPFAGTWWGNAWVGALEQGALDAKRLARGRGYADQGHVDAITVTPGLVLAYVRGSRPRPYRVQVRVRTLEDEDWERFLDAAADRPGHIAALLDKELPQSFADCGVPLLPGPGDLAPRCSCPDSGHPCKHAAALCYQTARLLDADPFVLLLLRGRGERELLDALSRRSAARAARAARERQPQTLPGVRAADALAPRELPPLPRPLPVPPHPEQPPAYPSVPGGPDPFALDQLATDAAARAHALLATGRDPVGELTLWQDAVRLAAARPGSGLTAATRTLYATLADAARRTPADLARAVAAWRQGGAAGLAALEEPWDPPAGRFDRARPLLLAADLPAFRPWRNRLTHPRGHVQLRLGRDGLWYAYESDPGQDDWWPRGTPDLDPVGALTGLGIPDDAV